VSKLIKILIGIGIFIFFLLWMMIPYAIEKPVVTVDYFTQYNDLLRPQDYQAAENAATLLDNLPEPQLKEEQEDFADFIWSYEYEDYPAKFKPEDALKVRDWMVQYQHTLEALSVASRKSYFFKPVDPAVYRSQFLNDQWSYTNTDFDLSHLSGMLNWATVYHLEEGSVEKAVESIETSVNLYKLMNTPVGHYLQWQVEQLIDSLDYVIAYLQRNESIDSKTLLHLQEFFAKASDFPDYDFSGQQLVYRDFIQKAFTEGDRGHLAPSVMLKQYGADYLDIDNTGTFFSTLYKCIKCERRKTTADRMEAIFAKLDQWKGQSLYQLHEQGIDVEKELEALAGNNFLVQEQVEMLLPLFRQPQQNACKMEAIAAIAALRRYQIETGGYPDSLETLLQAGYLDRLPQDCYSADPLAYRKQNDDFILYSFGVDCEDDGGKQSLCQHCGDHFVDWGNGPVNDPRTSTNPEQDAKGDHVFWPLQQEPVSTIP
jgi:hypothetical protein